MANQIAAAIDGRPGTKNQDTHEFSGFISLSVVAWKPKSAEVGAEAAAVWRFERFTELGTIVRAPN